MPLCLNDHEVADGQPYCGSCGAEVVVTCPNGHQVGASNDFCIECGAALNGGSEGGVLDLGEALDAEDSQVDEAAPEPALLLSSHAIGEESEKSDSLPVTAETDDAETHRGARSLLEPGRARVVVVVALLAIIALVVGVVVATSGDTAGDNTASEEGDAANGPSDGEAHCTDASGDVEREGQTIGTVPPYLDLLGTSLLIQRGVLRATFDTAGEIPTEESATGELVTFTIHLLEEGVDGALLYDLSLNDAASDYRVKVDAIDGAEGQVGGDDQPTFDINGPRVTLSVPVAFVPDLPSQFQWSGGIGVLGLPTDPLEWSQDACNSLGAAVEPDTLLAFPNDEPPSTPATQRPTTTTAIPVSTAPPASPGTAEAEAVFADLVQQACNSDSTDPSDPLFIPDPTLATATPSAGDEYTIVDAQGTVLTLNVASRVLYPAGGPAEETPRNYSFGCDPNVFLGTVGD